MTKIYLDYNATTPLRSEVKAAMVQAMDVTGNPSSVHAYGRKVRQHLESARQTIADFFKAEPKQIIFTSGATEANNLALKGFDGIKIVSAIEHDSIHQVCSDALSCPVDEDGVVNLEKLESLLQSHREEKVLVSVMAANNETGVIQPISEIAALVKKHQAFFHCDATQAVGKLTIDWSKIAFDMVSISSHKIGGPAGVGALIVSPNIALKAQIVGGGQERSYRGGTENILGIIGFEAALKECLNDPWGEIRFLRDRFEDEIQAFCLDVDVFGKSVPRLPNTSNLTMPGVKSDVQLMNFDLSGIAVSAGSACSSGKVKTSRILQAMGLPSSKTNSAIRVSLGWQTQPFEIEAIIDTWKQIYSRCAPQSFSKSTQEGIYANT
jgi:cysteine desulfurase